MSLLLAIEAGYRRKHSRRDPLLTTAFVPHGHKLLPTILDAMPLVFVSAGHAIRHGRSIFDRRRPITSLRCHPVSIINHVPAMVCGLQGHGNDIRLGDQLRRWRSQAIRPPPLRGNFSPGFSMNIVGLCAIPHELPATEAPLWNLLP